MTELFKKRNAKKLTGLYLDDALYTKAKEVAAREGISANQVLVDLVKLGFSTLENNK